MGRDMSFGVMVVMAAVGGSGRGRGSTICAAMPCVRRIRRGVNGWEEWSEGRGRGRGGGRRGERRWYASWSVMTDGNERARFPRVGGRVRRRRRRG